MYASIIAMIGGFVAVKLFADMRVPQKLWSLLSQEKASRFVFALLLTIFSVGLTILGILRHYSFHSNALDMGLMDQILWNTVNGHLLQETFTSNQSQNFLGHHFSPSLLLLSPLYFVAPSPMLLVAVQVLFVCLGVVLIYRLLIETTGEPLLALSTAFALLFHPFLHDALLFDFHQDIIGFFFGICALYGWCKQKRWFALLCWVIALCSKEEMAVYGAVFGLFLLVAQIRDRRFGLYFAVVHIAWLFLIVEYVLPWFRNVPSTSFEFYSRYSLPVSLWDFFTPARVGGLAQLVLPFAYFLWSKQKLNLLLLAPLSINFLSNLEGQHSFRFHYSLLPLLAIVAACIYAAREYNQKPIAATSLRKQILFQFVCASLLFVGVSPLGLKIPATIAQYTITTHVRNGHEFLKSVPEDSAIIAQNRLAAHLGQRRQITLVSRNLQIQPEYYLFDLKSSTAPLDQTQYFQLLIGLLSGTDYGAIHAGDGYLLLQKGAKITNNNAVLSCIKRIRIDCDAINF